MDIKVAPSILSADFSCLAGQIKQVERAGADLLHIDVMDGHFVPNITIGPVVVKHIRKVTKLPLDVHLMIEEPENFIDAFISSGSDMITVHIEAITSLKLEAIASRLKAKGIKLGIALNPSTPLAKLNNALSSVDFVLVMSVNPGFGGQKFMPLVIPKIKKLKEAFGGDISVDGGLNDIIASQLIKAGANILVAGSYIFGATDKKRAIERMKNARQG